ncbi:MAG: hypothetical protein M0Z33_00025 [Actinomycetota bacterium]|nr:hypothetical protein [Actinomycetota bacterium]
MRHWHRKRQVPVAPTSDVVSEAERLLTGRARDAFDAQRGAPAWVAVNLLAHATPPELRGVAAQCSPDRAAGFSAALGYLAASLLSCAPSAPELLALQRSELVPLELRLLDDPSHSPATLGQLTALVLDTLDAHRAHRDR